MDEQGTDKSAVEQIDQAVQGFLAKLGSEETRLSVGDVMRLMELRKELARDQVREVKVTWVESNPDPFAINT